MKLRFATADDVGAILDIIRPLVSNTPIVFASEPPDIAERAAQIAGTQLPYIAAEDDGGVLGYAFARPYGDAPGQRWTVEIGIALAERARGKRLGVRLYGAVLRLLEAQGYRTVIGVITMPNDASERLHAHFGFRRIGVVERAGYKLGRWHDVAWWQKLLGEADTPPREPRAIAEVAHLLAGA